MMQRQYRPGDVIFRAGDTSSTICRLAAGRAELIARQDGADAAVAVFEAGDMVGEMEALAGRPRDGTLRAVTEVQIDHLQPGDFLQWVSENQITALDLIQRLSTALQDNQADDAEQAFQEERRGRAAQAVPDEPPAIIDSAANAARPESKSGRLMLYPGHRKLNKAIPKCGMEIASLPFTVGRMSERREPRLVLVPDLIIEESSPFLLSRAHFLIARESNGVVVRDLGSTHGTAVNGKRLGDKKPDDAAALKPGTNKIQAGGPKSHYIFKVDLQVP